MNCFKTLRSQKMSASKCFDSCTVLNEYVRMTRFGLQKLCAMRYLSSSKILQTVVEVLLKDQLMVRSCETTWVSVINGETTVRKQTCCIARALFL